MYQALHLTRDDELGTDDWSIDRGVLEQGKLNDEFQRFRSVASQIAVVFIAAKISGENFCFLDGSRDLSQMEDNFRAMRLSRKCESGDSI